MKDESRGEPYRLVFADGPGRLRIWAPESKDDEKADGGPAKPPGGERRAGRSGNEVDGRFLLRADDRQGQRRGLQGSDVHRQCPRHQPAYREPRLSRSNATGCPTTALQLDPPGISWWSGRARTRGSRTWPKVVQCMYAKGNAFMQNDEYDGWGDEILQPRRRWCGSMARSSWCRLASRVDVQSRRQCGSRKIRLDRALNRYTVIDGSGGQFVEGNGGGNDDGLESAPAAHAAGQPASRPKPEPEYSSPNPKIRLHPLRTRITRRIECSVCAATR